MSDDELRVFLARSLGMLIILVGMSIMGFFGGEWWAAIGVLMMLYGNNVGRG